MSEKNSPESQAITPDAIYTEEGQEIYRKEGAEEPRSETPHLGAKSLGPIQFRLLCLLGAFFTAIWVGVVTFFVIFTLFLGALTLFRNPVVNNSIKSLMRHLYKSVIAVVGLLLGVILPPLGIGIIMALIADSQFAGQFRNFQ